MNDLLPHIFELKEAVAAQTVLIQETRADVKANAKLTGSLEKRVSSLEIVPKAGKAVLWLLITLGTLIATWYGIFKA